MNGYNDSSAFAYERFSTRPGPTVQPEPEKLPERKPARAAIPYGKYGAVAVAIFLVLGAIVFEYMQLARLTNENDRLRTEITSLESEENALKAKREKIYNLPYVEDYAKNVLGMVKLDKSQIVYLELTTEDQMEISEQETRGSAFWQSIIRSFDVVLEYLN